jgi:predicted Zn-dependent protease
MASTSADSESFPARYVDGVSAIIVQASVQASSAGLLIRWDGGETIWSWREITRLDSAPADARLGLRGGHPSRVTMADADWRKLRPAHGGDGRVSLGREAKIGGALLAAATTIALIVLFGMPLLASAVSAWAPPSVEEQMGVAAERQVSAVFKVCPGPQGERGQAILTGLAQNLAAHSTSRFPVRVTIVRAPLPNAFALPGGALIVTSALIDTAASPDEVAGVLAHEIGHVAERHVMKGFVRSMAIGAIADLVIGRKSSAAAPIAAAAVNISTLRFSRDDEAQADERAIEYMQAMGLDPAALARFFDRVSKIEKKAEVAGVQTPEFLSSHPDTGRRAALARARARPGAPQPLSAAEWAEVKAACADAR